MNHLLREIKVDYFVPGTFHPTSPASYGNGVMKSNAMNEEEKAKRFPTDSFKGCSRRPFDSPIAVFGCSRTCASLPFWTWPTRTISQRYRITFN